MSLYLSQLVLDPTKSQTRSELARPYEVHRTLAHAFADPNSARVLFRMEPDNPAQPMLLVQSHGEPEWDRAADHLPHVRQHQVVELKLRWIEQRAVLRFRLQCRPTKRLPGGGAVRADGRPRDGARVVLKANEELFAWLARQADTHGFMVEEAAFDRAYWLDSRGGIGNVSAGVDKEHTVVSRAVRRSSEPLFGAVRFDGTLVVTDVEKLRDAMANGIGPQKAFGFGLLSVAPVR